MGLSQSLFFSPILIALTVGSATFEEGAAGTMPAQVCATLSYNVLSDTDGSFSTPAIVTFTPVPVGGAGKYLTIRSTKLRSRMGINFSTIAYLVSYVFAVSFHDLINFGNGR